VLNGITHIIDYINVLIKEYPLVFHAFVPVGTILTAILGMKNASHIKTQANIQREIESNRFNIDLFEKRLMIYNEVKDGLKGQELYKIDDIGKVLEKISITIDNDVGYLKKAILVFNSDDNAIIESALYICSMIKDSAIRANKIKILQRKAYFEKANLDYEMTTDNRDYRFKLYYLETKIRGLNEEFEEEIKHIKSRFYYLTFLQLIKYMESKLLIPKEAFQPKTSFSRRTWNALSRDEKMVMYAIFGICALGLWCALLFEVAFKK